MLDADISVPTVFAPLVFVIVTVSAVLESGSVKETAVLGKVELVPAAVEISRISRSYKIRWLLAL